MPRPTFETVLYERPEPGITWHEPAGGAQCAEPENDLRPQRHVSLGVPDINVQKYESVALRTHIERYGNLGFFQMKITYGVTGIGHRPAAC